MSPPILVKDINIEGIERIIELINIDNLTDPIKVGFIVYGEQIYKCKYNH